MIFRSQLCGVCVSDSSGYRYFMFEYYHTILLFEMPLNSMEFNEALESSHLQLYIIKFATKYSEVPKKKH